jgi:hypothetical protein
MLVKLERSANVFWTAMASLNGGGCVGYFALHELMTSCSYIPQVVVVMRIVMDVDLYVQMEMS